MSMTDRLLKQLESRGLSVKPGAKPDELLLFGPKSEATPEIMAALKAFKKELLARFGKVETVTQPDGSTAAEPARRESETPADETEDESCPVCARDMSDPESWKRLEGVNPFCDRGGTREVTDGHGAVHPASPRCPYRLGD